MKQAGWGSSRGSTEVMENTLKTQVATNSHCPTCVGGGPARPPGWVCDNQQFFPQYPFKSQILCVKLLAFVLHSDLSHLLPTCLVEIPFNTTIRF